MSNCEKENNIVTTKDSCLQEKQDLQNLNNRLACYIDKMRHFEMENTVLSNTVLHNKEATTREINKIKSIFEDELSSTKKTLYEFSVENSKLMIDAKHLWRNNEDLKMQLDGKLKKLEKTENSIVSYKKKQTALQSQLRESEIECKMILRKQEELKVETEKLKVALIDTHANIKLEKSACDNFQDQINVLTQKINSANELYHKTLSELSIVKQKDTSTTDLAARYEDELQQSLQAIRKEYEIQLYNNRKEIEDIYKQKLRNLTFNIEKHTQVSSSLIKELERARITISNLYEKLSNLESIDVSLNGQVRILECQIEKQKTQHLTSTSILKSDLMDLKKEMENQSRKYRNLKDITIVLNTEISKYRRLIESEEERLNLKPKNFHNSTLHTPHNDSK